jgi:hypothetical protein
VNASPKPILHWVNDDAAKVMVHKNHIGDLFWNGMEWFFMPYDLSGNHLTTDFWSYIKVDTARWVQLRDKGNTLAETQHTKTEAERAALHAELELERKEFRDDTKEFAVLAAVGKGRVWWRTMYNLWLAGCTGGPEKFGGGVIHDGDSCPVHEA